MLPLLVALNGGKPAQANGLKADECVMLMPGIVKVPDGSRDLQAEFSVWVYENERRPGMRTLFARYLDIDRDALSEAEHERYEQRTSLFLKDSERGKTVSIRVDGFDQPILMPETNSAGRSRLVAPLPRHVWQGRGNPIPYQVSGCEPRAEYGLLWPIEAEGVSIVSDIDDTIKVSDVQDTKQLLRNTFLKPFEAAPGMAAWYRQMGGLPPVKPVNRGADQGRQRDLAGEAGGESAEWHAETSDTSSANVAVRDDARRAPKAGGTDIQFHYLSSSPLQLLPLLTAFLSEANFPPGTLMLRESTSWRSLLPGDGDSEAHKHAQLRRLITTFPKRQFVLIGDSGEADPEIYAEVARQYPRQVRAIFIRDVTGEKADAPRYQRTFGSLPRQKWFIIADGAEGKAAFDRAGIL
ncbi:MAG: App1 family protein [Lautropia sp.]|nr:App1 family protein [Lautropia sp.]